MRDYSRLVTFPFSFSFLGYVVLVLKFVCVVKAGVKYQTGIFIGLFVFFYNYVSIDPGCHVLHCSLAKKNNFVC